MKKKICFSVARSQKPYSFAAQGEFQLEDAAPAGGGNNAELHTVFAADAFNDHGADAVAPRL